MYDFDETAVRRALMDLIAPDAVIHMPWPFGDLVGPEALYEVCYAPLFVSLPDLERRDWIVMAGPTEHGGNWVGCGGHYIGTFVAPWLDIPPTGHLAHMRFHEFYRFEEGRVVEVQTLWDIPEVMMQAGAWPMAPSLGLEFHIPGPASVDGHVAGPWDEAQSQASCQHIVDMLDHMKRHPSQGGPEVMEMAKFWHPKMNCDGNYAAVTGWPDMIQTVTHDGWMGIAPSGKRITMCSLDFWRIENGLIRENWVLVDLLDAYRQLGVDVLARMREFNKARVSGSIPYPVGDI